jgi:hypothetical protein
MNLKQRIDRAINLCDSQKPAELKGDLVAMYETADAHDREKEAWAKEKEILINEREASAKENARLLSEIQQLKVQKQLESDRWWNDQAERSRRLRESHSLKY